MKKFIAIILTMVFIFGTAACSSKGYELPHDQFCFSLYPPQGHIELTAEARGHIIDLLNDGSWKRDLAKCDCDFVFYTQRQEIKYHSECGTFNDITSRRSLTLPAEDRITVNAFLGIE